MRRSFILSHIARVFLSGEPAPEQIVSRCSRAMGKSWRWLPGLAKRYVANFSGKTRPRHKDVVEFLRNDPKFQKIWHKYARGWWIADWIAEPQQMHPVAAAR